MRDSRSSFTPRAAFCRTPMEKKMTVPCESKDVSIYPAILSSQGRTVWIWSEFSPWAFRLHAFSRSISMPRTRPEGGLHNLTLLQEMSQCSILLSPSRPMAVERPSASIAGHRHGGRTLNAIAENIQKFPSIPEQGQVLAKWVDERAVVRSPA